MGRPATDKRERLVKSAMDRFHKQGYARTSVAEIAKGAGMAPGNVFYYFKAKDDVARAVVDEWRHLLTGYLADLEPKPDAWRRLEGFVDQARLISAIYVEWGCPLAGLARDLRQGNASLKTEAARIYAVQLAWLIDQFGQTGFGPAESEAHAQFLMAGYHGSILLAYAQDDATLIDRATVRLKDWLAMLRERQ